MSKIQLLIVATVTALFAASTPATATPVNHALHRYATASTVQAPLWPGLAIDGNPYSRWKSTATGVFPQHLMIDFGYYPPPLTRVVVKLDPTWPGETLIISVSGAASSTIPWTYLAPINREYVFNPATGNAVTIPVTVSSPIRWLRISVTHPALPDVYLAEVEAYSQ